VFWLAAPVVVTALAAVGSWLRGRPRREPGTDETMRDHSEFLAALSRAPRTGGDPPD
jgi:hypothetical protein